MNTVTYRLRTGELVTSKDGDRPTTYANRTQAERAAAKIAGAEVISRGRPFYVRLPEPGQTLTVPIHCPHCAAEGRPAIPARACEHIAVTPARATGSEDDDTCPDCGGGIHDDHADDCPAWTTRKE